MFVNEPELGLRLPETGARRAKDIKGSMRRNLDPKDRAPWAF